MDFVYLKSANQVYGLATCCGNWVCT